MKHYLPFIFLTIIICWKPTPTGKGQDSVPQDSLKLKTREIIKTQIQKIQSKGDSLEELKQDLFVEAFKNQQAMKKEKPKVVFIKVYQEVPKKKYAKDYIEVEEKKLQLLINDSITTIPEIKPDVKRPGFFKRLTMRFFHKKPKP